AAARGTRRLAGPRGNQVPNHDLARAALGPLHAGDHRAYHARVSAHRMGDRQLAARRRRPSAAGAGRRRAQIRRGCLSMTSIAAKSAAKTDVTKTDVKKIDVKPEWWDNIFAPSSCLTLITTVDAQGRVNAAAFGTCTRVCHDPMYIAFTCSAGKDTTD